MADAIEFHFATGVDIRSAPDTAARRRRVGFPLSDNKGHFAPRQRLSTITQNLWSARDKSSMQMRENMAAVQSTHASWQCRIRPHGVLWNPAPCVWVQARLTGQNLSLLFNMALRMQVDLPSASSAPLSLGRHRYTGSLVACPASCCPHCSLDYRLNCM